jgi:CRP-like cAMP-binding protein
LSVHQDSEVLAGLSRSYLFEGMTPEQLQPLASAATRRRLVRGEYVFRGGEPADDIFVVLSGEVKDCVVDVEGYEVIHFIHGPGMTFGEAGYFSVERTRIIAVIAVTPTVLIRLDRRDLGPFMDRHASLRTVRSKAWRQTHAGRRR